MEPTTIEVVVMHTEVEAVAKSKAFDCELFKLKDLAAVFHVQHVPFSPGDRVRITITKEPADAYSDVR